jgi:hypothetical protein
LLRCKVQGNVDGKFGLDFIFFLHLLGAYWEHMRGNPPEIMVIPQRKYFKPNATLTSMLLASPKILENLKTRAKTQFSCILPYHPYKADIELSSVSLSAYF